jgi:hypothetical protein
LVNFCCKASQPVSALIGLSAFAVTALMLSLHFIGEAVRDAFDPRRRSVSVSSRSSTCEPRSPRQSGEPRTVVARVSPAKRANAPAGESGQQDRHRSAIVRLLQPAASYPSSEIFFRGRDVLKCP